MMQILKGEHDLRAVEARMRLGESTHAPQMREHFTARHKLEYHEQIQIILYSNNKEKKKHVKCPTIEINETRTTGQTLKW